MTSLKAVPRKGSKKCRSIISATEDAHITLDTVIHSQLLRCLALNARSCQHTSESNNSHLESSVLILGKTQDNSIEHPKSNPTYQNCGKRDDIFAFLLPLGEQDENAKCRIRFGCGDSIFSDMKARLAELLKWKIIPSVRFLFIILIGPPLI